MQNTDTILIALVATVGSLVFLQFVILLGMFLTMRKGIRKAQQYGDEMRATITPVLHQSREVLEKTKDVIVRLEPKLDAAASDLAEMTRSARGQLLKIEASADEISERFRRQAARIDGMTSSTLNGVDRVGHFLSDAVSIPVRQVSGILAAAKAVVDTLRAPAPAQRTTARSAESAGRPVGSAGRPASKTADSPYQRNFSI